LAKRRPLPIQKSRDANGRLVLTSGIPASQWQMTRLAVDSAVAFTEERFFPYDAARGEADEAVMRGFKVLDRADIPPEQRAKLAVEHAVRIEREKVRREKSRKEKRLTDRATEERRNKRERDDAVIIEAIAQVRRLHRNWKKDPIAKRVAEKLGGVYSVSTIKRRM